MEKIPTGTESSVFPGRPLHHLSNSQSTGARLLHVTYSQAYHILHRSTSQDVDKLIKRYTDYYLKRQDNASIEVQATRTFKLNLESLEIKCN